MAKQEQSQSQPTYGGNLNVNIRDLEPGDQFKTTSGGTAEVVMNPKDGLWVVIRYLEPPSDEPDKAGAEDMVYVDGVGELVSTANKQGGG